MTAAEVILAAVERLTPETWRKSGWGPHGVTTNVRAGTECLLDALSKAAGGDALFGEAKRAVRKVIVAQYRERLATSISGSSLTFVFPDVSIIPIFNDHKLTTLDDLRVVRDKAIAELGGLP